MKPLKGVKGAISTAANKAGRAVARAIGKKASKTAGRQRGRVVRAPDLKSGRRGFKSRSDHLAGVVSWWTLVPLLGHACK